MKFLRIQDELNFAKKRYELTKKIETSFVDAGFIQIKPEIFEEYDEITAIDKNISTKSMVKVVSNKVMVLRPDITISLMKSLIPRWEDDLNLKLFYHSTVYKNEGREGIKEIRQFGCEYLGEKSIEADREIVHMSLDILYKFGERFILEIGNSNYIEGLLKEFRLKEHEESKLKNLILRKNKIEIKSYIKKFKVEEKIKETLLNLFELNGTIEEVLVKANKLYKNDLMEKGLKEIQEIAKLISKSNYKKYINCDLSMVGKFDYYEGIMIKGYYSNVYKEILSGGRYDRLTEEFGKRLPAIGFCIDVDGLMEASKDRS